MEVFKRTEGLSREIRAEAFETYTTAIEQHRQTYGSIRMLACGEEYTRKMRKREDFALRCVDDYLLKQGIAKIEAKPSEWS